MPSTIVDVQSQYNKEKRLRKDDVKALLEWADKQPHLPKINELQAILFLHSCDYSSEFAKTTIDAFFTGRTAMPEIFKNRDTLSNPLRAVIDLGVIAPLPRKTPEGYTIFFSKLVSSNSEEYHFQSQLKYFDMVCMMHLYQNGISNGHVMVADSKLITLGHVTKMGPVIMKKFLLYVQESLPVRLKQIHFFNATPIMGKLLGLIKPFLRQDLAEILYMHENVEGLTKFVPLECLPEDYGGKSESIEILHQNIKNKLVKNSDFFDWEETFVVDESKRVGRVKNNDLYGMDGTFKKLEID